MTPSSRPPPWPDTRAVSYTRAHDSWFWFRRRLREALLPWRIPVACLALMAANVAVFLFEEFWGGSLFHVTLYRMGSGHGPASFGAEAWRLLTSGYLHLGWRHLVINLVTLLLSGMYLEGLLGPSRLLLVYTLSIVASTLVGVGYLPEALVVGASGGICGLVGALLVLACNPHAPFSRGRRIVCLLVVAAIMTSTVYAACKCGQMIANVVHLAGGVLGAVLALSGALLWRLRWWPGAAELRAVCAGAYVAVWVTVACLLCAFVWERPWEVRQARALMRLRMPGTPVTVAVPIGSVSRTSILENIEDGDSSTWVRFGDVLRDPLMVEVTAEQLEEVVPEERLAEKTKALRERLYREAQGPQEEGSSMWSMPSLRELNGRLAVNSSRTVGTLFWASRWTMYRDDWLITLEVYRAYSGLPESWEQQEEEVMRSVVMERASDPPWNSCATWNAGRTGVCPAGPW